MSKLVSLSGECFGGNHSTFVPTAATMVKILTRLDPQCRVSAGVMKRRIGGGGGRKHIKFDARSNVLTIKVTDGSINQEVRVYGITNTGELLKQIEQQLKPKGITVTMIL